MTRRTVRNPLAWPKSYMRKVLAARRHSAYAAATARTEILLPVPRQPEIDALSDGAAQDGADLKVFRAVRLLREAIALTHIEAHKARVIMRLAPGGSAAIDGDPRTLRQLFLEALKSAIESAGAGRTVSLAARTFAGNVIVEIAHNGLAWSADDVPLALRASIPRLRPGLENTKGSPSIRASRLALIASLAAASKGSLTISAGNRGGRVLRLTLPAATQMWHPPEQLRQNQIRMQFAKLLSA